MKYAVVLTLSAKKLIPLNQECKPRPASRLCLTVSSRAERKIGRRKSRALSSTTLPSPNFITYLWYKLNSSASSSRTVFSSAKTPASSARLLRTMLIEAGNRPSERRSSSHVAAVAVWKNEKMVEHSSNFQYFFTRAYPRGKEQLQKWGDKRTEPCLKSLMLKLWFGPTFYTRNRSLLITSSFAPAYRNICLS